MTSGSKSHQFASSLSYANGALWAIGNGLVSSTLVIYLALELGAEGIAISAIVAAPRLVGVARLVVPELIARLAPQGFGRKEICLAGYATSALVLTLIPLSAIQAAAWGMGWGIALLVVTWSLYHLLEYGATVALWSWLGDLYPVQQRSAYVGCREQWLVIGRVVGMLASFGLAKVWRRFFPGADAWEPLALSAALGACCLLLAVVPLLAMPALATTASARPRRSWRTVLEALAKRPFRRLLYYSCGLSIANGLTATVQAIYPGRLLGVRYETLLAMRGGMYAGQTVLAPAAGRLIDRHGARLPMTVAQLLVALGPLCFFFAQGPSSWGWLVAAYLLWIAYVVLNVGLDTLKLAHAAPQNNSPAIALYHTASDLSFGLMVLFGGFVYDALQKAEPDRAVTICAALFLLGWIARSLMAVLAWRLIDTPSK